MKRSRKRKNNAKIKKKVQEQQQYRNSVRDDSSVNARLASCLVFIVVNEGVIRPLTGRKSAAYLTAGDPQGCRHDADAVATGR